MEDHFQQISDSQKTSWNKFSPGWKKWQSKLYDHMQPAADGIINLLNPSGSQLILDIAAGTGEPGLSIAKMLTGGKVILTDLSPQMLDIAKENAAKKGITNVEFEACDVTELPFADNTFDGVSCRMGFMFFPDMILAAKEIRRVLKPGGKLATSVWGTPEQNFWGTAIGDAIIRNMNLPNPKPDSPGIFRCGESGLMTNILEQAGFKNITEREVTCELNCGTAEIYWEIMTEIAAPIVTGLHNADRAMKEKIKKEVCGIIREKYSEGEVIISGTAFLIYGKK
ncbi:class I SAM-dependent methyltransferase [Kaistella antarctica]|uniref:Demethylmenaquinone methyltransferase n=1 Tax=Kaistella antarctica TaxID=266748 RepID=A0A448NQJ5_9FLAO|nr:class I SAM-dependent methyltransferase [Kaistella antarctica]KEY19074.1 methyltransferase type 11 [Kaistella antarctica]SEW11907.1 Ubiquinone/menaquinone biosynthesis C-methylase UbiE [Kaistella antarctica]VEH98935.1 Demethylmenaquinone methyltransferase [Kaistella antarctica]